MEEGAKLVGLERVTENDDGDNASDNAAVEAEVVSETEAEEAELEAKDEAILKEEENDEKIFNFAAGPSAMPLPVLEQAASEMTDWHGVGYSILEMSHRSKEFMGIYGETVEMLRELYGIPEEYEVMFVQGGGHLQFAMIPLNFAVGGIGNYAVDGVWSLAKLLTKHRRSARLPKLPALNSEPLVGRTRSHRRRCLSVLLLQRNGQRHSLLVSPGSQCSLDCRYVQ